jgi:hypothetical protein
VKRAFDERAAGRLTLSTNQIEIQADYNQECRQQFPSATANAEFDSRAIGTGEKSWKHCGAFYEFGLAAASRQDATEAVWRW